MASPVSLAAGTYWIGLIDGSATDVFGLRYDTGAPNSGAVTPAPYASGPPPSFNPSRLDTEQVSLYAMYQ